MKECLIRLNGIDSVKRFVDILKNADGDFELVSGKYVIDAKSIMGIFSLDLTKPMELRAEKGYIPDTVIPFVV